MTRLDPPWDQPRARRGTPPTARALAAFRDELTAEGFDPDTIRDLILIACEGEIRNDGLSITTPPEQSGPFKHATG